jgi:segregation and condensation protein B
VEPSQTTIHAVEAVLIASSRPIMEADLQSAVGSEDLSAVLAILDGFWRDRGLTILRKDGAVGLAPSPGVIATFADLDKQKGRRLTEAAVQTLCYIAINQPVTQKNIEAARSVVLFKGVIDSLMDAGFIRTSIRKTDSGRALTYVTTELFLEHFGLLALSDLPTQDELFELVNPGGAPLD